MSKAIPKGLQQEHILSALRDLDRGVEHPFGEPKKYKLVHDGKRYPPKTAVGLAFKYFRDTILPPGEFSGGEGAGQANHELRKLGFVVEPIHRESELELVDNVDQVQSPQSWAFLANPRRYRIDDAVRELSEDLWKVPRGDVEPGDHIAIWRASGGRGHRGIIALATALTAPELLSQPDHLLGYWVDRPPAAPQRCAWVRYHQSHGLPLWLNEDQTGLLSKLSVSRARGGSVFQMSPDQWERLETLADIRTPTHENVPPDFDEAAEGRVLIRQHKARERNQRLVQLKKEHALRDGGNFVCDVCGFEFMKAYGTDYIECHHIVPLSELESPTTTKLEDLSLVCANCHRMLHTGGDNLDIDKLRAQIRVQYSYGDDQPSSECHRET
jgi:hypothetical protein